MFFTPRFSRSGLARPLVKAEQVENHPGSSRRRRPELINSDSARRPSTGLLRLPRGFPNVRAPTSGGPICERPLGKVPDRWERLFGRLLEPLLYSRCRCSPTGYDEAFIKGAK